MTQIIRSGFLSIICCIALLAAPSCSKKEDTQPTSTNPAVSPGSAEGSVSPAGSVTAVTITNSGGQAFVAKLNATTGAYTVPNLTPGNYTLSFTAAVEYNAPASRNITIASGLPTLLGVTVVSAATSGAVRGTISPSNSVTRDGIRAINKVTRSFYDLSPRTDGSYQFDNLPLGDYIIIFNLATGWTSPVSRSVSIVGGTVVDLGNTIILPITPGTLSGTISWNSDFSYNSGGSPSIMATGTITGSITPTTGQFNLTGRADFDPTGPNAHSEVVSFGADVFYGAGEYPIPQSSVGIGTNASLATGYDRFSVGQGRSSTSGTMVVTSYNASTRTITGTFAFNGGQGPFGRNIAIANGTFTARF
jgi:hypothetical protein